jgi:hypothetical protein
MPIRKELLHLYKTPEYKAARDRVRLRAGGVFDPSGRYLGGARCEQCGVEDRKTALRACGWWTPATLEATVHKMGGRFTDGRPEQLKSGTILLPWTTPGGYGPRVMGIPRECCRWVGIILTCAHLNHTAGDDRDENLKMLCQWCHLSFDSPFHRLTRATRKDSGRPLLSV